MSPSSTELYYNQLNTKTRAQHGGLHSADCLIRSVNFAEIAALQTAGDWETAGEQLATAARGLEAGGAELLVLATNTMHKVAPEIKAAISIPFLDIFSCTAEAVVAKGCRRPALIATAYTMEQDFCLARLREAGLEPVVPNATERAIIHRIIFDELCIGRVTEESRRAYEGIARELLRNRGADGVILGCTEVGMLLNQGNVDAAVFDTTSIHVDAALAASQADASSS
jgi:aspartate racemase